jgi:hypothetical protein
MPLPTRAVGLADVLSSPLGNLKHVTFPNSMNRRAFRPVKSRVPVKKDPSGLLYIATHRGNFGASSGVGVLALSAVRVLRPKSAWNTAFYSEAPYAPSFR